MFVGALLPYTVQYILLIFLFKFYNNILATNLRVSKLNRETNPECTFCAINGPFPVPREDFSHIFFNCPSTKKIVDDFFDEYMTINVTTCSIFFGGNIAEKEEIKLIDRFS